MAVSLDLGDPRIAALAGPHAANLCDPCLGRLFARVGSGLHNEERGRMVRANVTSAPPATCAVCEGISSRFQDYARLCGDAAAGFEYASFLVGTVHFDEFRQREAAIHAELIARDPASLGLSVEAKANPPAWPLAEWLKNEVNREVGLRISTLTGKEVDFKRPDLTFRLDTRFDHVGLQVASVFGRGRYRKFARDLPQTRWPCRACGGIGCRQCNGSGKTYETSVEELVASPFVEAAGAQGEAFHGMGREDIDARTLGNGRPFVLELKRPRRRTLDWNGLGARVNAANGDRVEVLEMTAAAPEDAARYKEADPPKTYRARCASATPIERDRLDEVAKELSGTRLEQRTPQRVAHRRGDLVRQRTVRSVQVVSAARDRFELEIEADSGTYIKEFVSGDEGRTRPNLSDTLGTACRVEELDVVSIGWPSND